jgi:quinol monooxygenase YgiN
MWRKPSAIERSIVRWFPISSKKEDIMSELTVIARVKARPGKEKELEQAWSTVAGLSRKRRDVSDTSCIGLSPIQLSLSAWKNGSSKEANDKHMASAHIQELLRQVPRLSPPPPEILPFEVLG